MFFQNQFQIQGTKRVEVITKILGLLNNGIKIEFHLITEIL